MTIFRRKNETNSKGKNIIPLALRLATPRPPMGPSDGSNGALKRPIMEFGEGIWDLGWTDGRVGQPLSQNERVFQIHAKLTKQHTIKNLEGEIAGLKNECEREARLKETSDNAYTNAIKRLNEVKEERAKKLQEYSLVLGLVYLLVGFALFLSDIPLSLRLVAEGYKIPTEAILPDESILTIGEILSRPNLVLQYLWEPLLLALGLAFSGIFVKFFIDEVIWISNHSEKKPRRVSVFFSFVAALFVVTLVAVGVFRSNQQAFITSTTTSTWGSGFWSFLCITLMLPIIGGICFLAGWTRVQNWAFLQSCRLEVYRDLRKYKSASRRLSSAKEGLEAALSQLQTLTTGNHLEADLWESLYRHGYWRGVAVPETLEDKEDLYTRCERLLTKQIATRARDEFWKQAAP